MFKPDYFALVVGASGFIGHHLMQRLGPGRAIGTGLRHASPDRLRFDARSDRLRDVLAAAPRPVTHVFLLHGGADIEACARDPLGTAQTTVDSTIAMIDDAIAAAAVPIWASTDYVLGDRGGWGEDEDAQPATEYGRQKLRVERYLRELTAPWIATRLSKVVGIEAQTHSVLGPWAADIKARRTVKCADDQVFSPAYVGDVVEVMAQLSTNDFRGLINVAGPVAYSRFGLASLLLAEVQKFKPGLASEIVSISLRDLQFLEQRPLNTSLDTSRLARLLAHSFMDMPTLCARVAALHFGDSVQ